MSSAKVGLIHVGQYRTSSGAAPANCRRFATRVEMELSDASVGVEDTKSDALRLDKNDMKSIDLLQGVCAGRVVAFNTKFLFRSELLPLIVTQFSTIKEHVCLYTHKQANDTDENDESFNNVSSVFKCVGHMKHELSPADASILCMYLLLAVHLLSVTYNTCMVESGGIGLGCPCPYEHI